MNLYDQVWQDPEYCPNGLDRAKEVFDELVKACVSHDWRVIDVGCGRGHVVDMLNERDVEAFGIDPFLPNAGLRHPRLLRGDLATLNKLDCIVDVVTSFDVLEHLTEEAAYDLMRTMRKAAPRACFAIANMEDVHDVAGIPIDLHLTKQPAIWWARMIRQHWSGFRIQPLPYPERFFLWAGDWQ